MGRISTEALDKYTRGALASWVDYEGTLLVAYRAEVSVATVYRALREQPLGRRARSAIVRAVAAHRGARWVAAAPHQWPGRALLEARPAL